MHSRDPERNGVFPFVYEVSFWSLRLWVSKHLPHKKIYLFYHQSLPINLQFIGINFPQQHGLSLWFNPFFSNARVDSESDLKNTLPSLKNMDWHNLFEPFENLRKRLLVKELSTNGNWAEVALLETSQPSFAYSQFRWSNPYF